MHEMQQMQTGGRCNKCECNKCDNRCNKFRQGGATNAATNVTTTTGATDADGNECLKTGVRDLCLVSQRVGDSNTNWRQQGALPRAHNLLENRQSSQTSVLKSE